MGLIFHFILHSLYHWIADIPDTFICTTSCLGIKGPLEVPATWTKRFILWLLPQTECAWLTTDLFLGYFWPFSDLWPTPTRTALFGRILRHTHCAGLGTLFDCPTTERAPCDLANHYLTSFDLIATATWSDPFCGVGSRQQFTGFGHPEVQQFNQLNFCKQCDLALTNINTDKRLRGCANSRNCGVGSRFAITGLGRSDNKNHRPTLLAPLSNQQFNFYGVGSRFSSHTHWPIFFDPASCNRDHTTLWG